MACTCVWPWNPGGGHTDHCKNFAAAATNQDAKSSVGSGCDSDPGRVSSAPQGGAQSRPAPKDWDYGPAVESLVAIHNHKPGRPPMHWPAPTQPRSVPPVRPATTITARQARLDHPAVTRTSRYRAALARIVRTAA